MVQDYIPPPRLPGQSLHFLTIAIDHPIITAVDTTGRAWWRWVADHSDVPWRTFPDVGE